MRGYFHGYLETTRAFHGEHQTRVLLSLLIALSLISCATGNADYARGTDTVSHKIDPHLARELSYHPAVEHRVSVLIRTAGTIDARERHTLNGLGVDVRSIIGDIVTATVAIHAVGAIAALPFVTYIEKAMPVQPATM